MRPPTERRRHAPTVASERTRIARLAVPLDGIEQRAVVAPLAAAAGFLRVRQHDRIIPVSLARDGSLKASEVPVEALASKARRWPLRSPGPGA